MSSLPLVLSLPPAAPPDVLGHQTAKADQGAHASHLICPGYDSWCLNDALPDCEQLLLGATSFHGDERLNEFVITVKGTNVQGDFLGRIWGPMGAIWPFRDAKFGCMCPRKFTEHFNNKEIPSKKVFFGPICFRGAIQRFHGSLEDTLQPSKGQGPEDRSPCSPSLHTHLQHTR